MALTIEQQEQIKARNAKIYERFCQLSETQPLAYPYTIYSAIAREYDMTPQSISLIVRTAQQNNTKQ